MLLEGGCQDMLLILQLLHHCKQVMRGSRLVVFGRGQLVCNSCDLCYWIFLFDISFLFLSSFSSFLSFPKRLSLHAHETALFRFPFRFPLLLFPYLHRESDLLSLLSFEGTILLPLHPRSHAVLVLYSHRLALAALV